MVSRIKPQVPTRAEMIDSVTRTFSDVPVFLANRPLCRSHLSETKARSRKMVMMQLPVMKSGLSPSAPTSEIYLSTLELLYFCCAHWRVCTLLLTLWFVPAPLKGSVDALEQARQSALQAKFLNNRQRPFQILTKTDSQHTQPSHGRNEREYPIRYEPHPG